MFAGKLAILGGVCALLLAGCGATAKAPPGNSPLSSARPLGRGVVDDPRQASMSCLRDLRLQLLLRGKTGLLLGGLGAQAQVVFEPTPGAAQAEQIAGRAQGAEAIGSALLFPGSMRDSQLTKVEKCLAKQAKG